MIPIPAIDLLNNQCVRLVRGDFAQGTVFSNDPLEVAGRWFGMGAPRLHIVDLNGAKSGQPYHHQVVKSIRDAHPDKIIQVGGGLRSMASIRYYLDAGVDFVILGTAAYKQPALLAEALAQYPGQIIVGIDARSDQLALEGWMDSDGQSALDFADKLQRYHVAAIIYTDINKDGMLSGVNFAATRAIAERSGAPVIASGGVASTTEYINIKLKKVPGIIGAIVGRALYEGNFDLREALAAD